jgi:hypothetical protein
MPSNTINQSPKVILKNVQPLGAPLLPAKPHRKTFFSTPTPAPVRVVTEETVYPLKENTRAFYTGIKNTFSLKNFKAIGKNTMLLGAGLAGGLSLAIFAGPQIQAAFIGLAASSAFPPVMIAIGATLGAALLAFGIYKLVQYCNKELKRSAKADEAKDPQQQQLLEPTGFGANGYVSAPAADVQDTTSVKPPSVKPSYAPSVAQQSQKTTKSSVAQGKQPEKAPVYTETSENVWK